MKKILFYISITLALLLPDFFLGQGATQAAYSNVMQHNDAFNTQQTNNYLLFDAFFEAFSEDDDSNESERKKDSSAQFIPYNKSFLAPNHPKYFLSKVLTAHIFFSRRIVIFLLLCVLRL